MCCHYFFPDDNVSLRRNLKAVLILHFFALGILFPIHVSMNEDHLPFHGMLFLSAVTSAAAEPDTDTCHNFLTYLSPVQTVLSIRG